MKVAARAKIEILIDYKGSHIFKVYILLRKGPIKNRIIQSLNIRFNKRGLIIKCYSAGTDPSQGFSWSLSVIYIDMSSP